MGHPFIVSLSDNDAAHALSVLFANLVEMVGNIA